MERCKDCELALYCYSDSSSWVFRTMSEMEEKKEAICNCPIHEKVQDMRGVRKKPE